MRRIGLVIFLLLMMLGCGNKNKLPKGILPQQKMQAIMWEMVSTNEFLSGYVFSKDTGVNQVAESQGWYKKVFELHQTTKAQFEKSYAYYKQHPDVMKILLDSLSNRQYKPDLARLRADSIKKATADSIAARSRPDSVGRLHVADSLRRIIGRPRKKIIRSLENPK